MPRILVVRLSAIGDCLHALPAVAALRAAFPDATIGWAIERAGAELLRGHPAVDRFHLFPHPRKEGRGWRRGLAALVAFRRELRAARYDVAIDLQGLAKSGLVAWASGARRRIGFAGRESRELNRLLVGTRVRPPESSRHVSERNLALLEPLGIDSPDVAWPLPDYGEEWRQMAPGLAASLPSGIGSFAVVNPGTTWDTKRWPAARFGEVARGLVERRVAVVVTWGGAAELRAAEEVAAAAGGEPWAVVAPPTSLRQLAALLERSRLFVGCDTGPLHLAAAVGVPSVAVFGATDPRRNGPWGEGHRVIVLDGLECRPCHSRRCARHDLACLQRLPPALVLAACEEVLGDRAAVDDRSIAGRTPPA